MDDLYVTESEPADRRSAVSRQIELAALELFLEHGIENVTVEEIAIVSGISRRTFYRYFDTVDDILLAGPIRSLRRMSRFMRARPETENLREAFIGASRQMVADHPELPVHRLAAAVARKFPESFWRVVSRMQSTTTEFYEEMVAHRLLLDGQDVKNAPLIATVLITVINQACREFMRYGDFEPDPDVLENMLDDLTRLLSSPS